MDIFDILVAALAICLVGSVGCVLAEILDRIPVVRHWIDDLPLLRYVEYTEYGVLGADGIERATDSADETDDN